MFDFLWKVWSPPKPEPLVYMYYVEERSGMGASWIVLAENEEFALQIIGGKWGFEKEYLRIVHKIVLSRCGDAFRLKIEADGH